MTAGRGLREPPAPRRTRPVDAAADPSGGSKSFGAVVVDDNSPSRSREGEALGILGPNGAGKTTLFNLITGVISPTVGRVLLAGRDITRCVAIGAAGWASAAPTRSRIRSAA